ncbi:AAA family ATPase [Streptomyces sp. NPDC007883]|uniref:ATP-binding protein n=1 Tax=Streptomyces sp. NPDC007883 TaxID=3155116 RepID=UPI0033F1606C
MRREGAVLLERVHERELLEAAVRRAHRGNGRMVVLEGAAGLGKTSLLRGAREEAADLGFGILHARGCELERDFPWTVVRQLFECFLDGGHHGEGRNPMAGPAALAGGIFDYGQAETRTGPAVEEQLYAALHGLYWLCRNLAERQPLLLVIDDAQWADAASLRFVSYLANRLDDDPILVVLATSPAEEAAHRDLLRTACAAPLAELVTLSELTPDAVRQLTAETLGDTPDESFAEACHTLTGGNPQHLLELLREVERAGIAPVAADVPRIHRLAPGRAAQGVRRRLDRLPDRAIALARAVAVLRGQAEPQHCARVAGLDEDGASEAAGVLRDAGLLASGTPYAFNRPVIRQVVYEGMPARLRNAAHRTAAECLSTDPATAVPAAEHLCRTDPGPDRWAADVLRAASSRLIGQGDPRSAARYLRRAMGELSAYETDASFWAELGAAELRAHEPAAVECLTEALHRGPRPDLERAIRLDLAQALAAAGRPDEAAETLSGHTSAGGSQLWALGAVLHRLFGTTQAPCPSGPPVEDRATLCAHAAAEALSRGRPLHRVARLSAAAVAGGVRLGPHDVELPPASIAAWVLAQCGDPIRAEGILNEVIAAASRAGHLLASATAEGLRAMVLLDTGRITEAADTARSLLGRTGAKDLETIHVPLATAVLVHCMIEQDRTAEAADLLARQGLADGLHGGAVHLPVRAARGRLFAALGRTREAVREFLDCRRLAQKGRWRHSCATGGWFVDGVRALALGVGASAARTLAFDEVKRASSLGAAQPLAAALCAYGEIVGGDKGIRRMEQADHLLAELPLPLDRARVLLALGGALRRGGDRSGARQRLTAAAELARGCAAESLENAAHAELRLTGARPAPATSKDAAALTPAEQRVADKASEGLTNKEIAQALFITVKTVEWHLGQAYSKLGIRKRSELARALSPVDAVPAQLRHSA